MQDDNQSGFEDDPYFTESKYCNDPLHNPPMFISIPPGKIYRHVCPTCKHTVRLGSNNITMLA